MSFDTYETDDLILIPSRGSHPLIPSCTVQRAQFTYLSTRVRSTVHELHLRLTEGKLTDLQCKT
jgi:hypothetical protein